MGEVWADVLSAACTCRWRKSRHGPGWLLEARDDCCPLRHGGGHD